MEEERAEKMCICEGGEGRERGEGEVGGGRGGCTVYRRQVFNVIR